MKESVCLSMASRVDFSIRYEVRFMRYSAHPIRYRACFMRYSVSFYGWKRSFRSARLS